MKPFLLLTILALPVCADTITQPIDESGSILIIYDVSSNSLTAVSSEPDRLKVTQDARGDVFFEIDPTPGATQMTSSDRKAYVAYVDSPPGCIGDQCAAFIGSFATGTGATITPATTVADLSYIGSFGLGPPGQSCVGIDYCTTYLTEGVPQLLATVEWGGPDAFANDTISIVMVPEPGSIWLASAALFLLIGRSRRRRSRRS